ncbi:universal stress protein Usp [Citrifermentans bemidjiense Bem]|uniref:Universal stress protein Usp n=1 Tax=Citrifermentans bemidjiense (strain ATCC BAA-1014 / DSM 16622 / JCM 12645 / Bem) TaxID=404380 RepID=B5E9D7_CITBB|nr:universal stress protein [Citrifermentans bemidjiense]ACH38679.1 universal stress protein Usp [Citrifermentans bemidjiense Bem]
MRSFDKILFATDFSESSDHAFEYALTMAKQFDSQLTILHVINEPVDLRGFYVPHISFENLEKEIEEGAEKMMGKFCASRLSGFTNYQCAIVTGVPWEEILKRAENDHSSCIVMGTQGRSGIDHLLFGSTAERVVRKALCPVVTVRLA